MCECESFRAVLEIYPEVVDTRPCIFYENGRLWKCGGEVKITKEACKKCGEVYLTEVVFPIDGSEIEPYELEE